MNLSDCAADHALGQALGSVEHLPHGLTIGLVLAETLELTRGDCADRLERVADALGEPAGGQPDGSRVCGRCAVCSRTSVSRRSGTPVSRRTTYRSSSRARRASRRTTSQSTVTIDGGRGRAGVSRSSLALESR